jgi:predicted PurR-regulated permease PerM
MEGSYLGTVSLYPLQHVSSKADYEDIERTGHGDGPTFYMVKDSVVAYCSQEYLVSPAGGPHRTRHISNLPNLISVTMRPIMRVQLPHALCFSLNFLVGLSTFETPLCPLRGCFCGLLSFIG